MVGRRWLLRARNAWGYYRWAGCRGAWRIIAAQQKGLDVASLHLGRSPHPVYFRPGTSDLAVIRAILVEGEADVPVRRPPRFIIDGGANIGLFSREMARRFPEATIIAVEPDAGNLEILRRNTAAFPNVRIIAGGIWPRKCHLKIVNPLGSPYSFQVRELSGPAPGAVEAFTIPELMSLAGASTIDLLKLDIEGSEKEVFATGTEAWLPRVRQLLIEIHPTYRPQLVETVYGALNKRPHRIRPQGEYQFVEFDEPPSVAALA